MDAPFILAVERHMLDLVNGARAAARAAPLAFDEALANAARAHAADMEARDYFSHSGLGGSSAIRRIVAANFRLWGRWQTAENLAWTTTAPHRWPSLIIVDRLHGNLMRSPLHRASVLNPNFGLVGIGFAAGDFQRRAAVFVVQVFARVGA